MKFKVKYFFITIIVVVLVIFLSIVILPIFTFAQGDFDANTNCENALGICNPIRATSIQCFVKDILEFVAQIGSIFIILALIYSGFLLVTARGNETQLSKGKQALLWTIIGGAIVLGAWALSIGIASTVSDITGSNLPIGEVCN